MSIELTDLCWDDEDRQIVFYCWLCRLYKPLSEMGGVACKECEGVEGEA